MSTCVLCKFSKNDTRYGEFIKKGNISVHEFCLYLSSGLVQNGQENNGLYGFLKKDIIAEEQRGKLLYCAYCRKPYASIGCCEKKCRRSFHMICGIENGCQNEFAGTFRSFCKSHIHKFLKNQPPLNEKCCICFDILKETGKPNHYVDMIKAPCCRNGWFHRCCLQNFARNSGYFFKCPLCNDTKKFRAEMPFHGVFVPDRDAAWELEPNAFAELLERPNKCEAEICKHKGGRNRDDDERNPLLYCTTCGAVAAHLLCLPNGASAYTCKDCQPIVETARSDGDSGRESFHEANNNDEDEEIDVCNVSDTDEEIDMLEKPFLQRRRRIISDSSDCNEKSTKKTLKNSINESSSDEDSFWRISLKRKIKANQINDADDSMEAVKKNGNNDSGSVNPLQTLSTKRRKILESESSQTTSQEESDEGPFCEQGTEKKSLDNQQSPRKPLKNLNSVATTNQKESSTSKDSSETETESTTEQNLLNFSCVANRTRRRKSIYYLNPLDSITESDSSESAGGKISSNLKNENIDAASSSKRISSYQSFSGFLSNSLKRSSSINEQKTIKNITKQASTSSSSLSSTRSSSTETTTSDSGTDNNILNVSCIANRTRRRKSVYYSKSDLETLTEQESQESSSSLPIFNNRNKVNVTKRNLNSLSSTDNSPELVYLKRSRVPRLISTTTDEDDDDAMKNR